MIKLSYMMGYTENLIIEQILLVRKILISLQHDSMFDYIFVYMNINAYVTQGFINAQFFTFICVLVEILALYLCCHCGLYTSILVYEKRAMKLIGTASKTKTRSS